MEGIPCGLVYSSCSSVDEAEEIAKTLVQKKFAACANIFPNIISYYENDGEVSAHNETALILKTRKSLYPVVEKEIKAMHSYECPCVVYIPFEKGFSDFLTWIASKTLRVR